MSFHIVLVTPEIAGNTGNIGRTCVATDTKLHLIRPLGFVINDKTLKRAGMDYWKHVDLEIHDSLEEFLENMILRTELLPRDLNSINISTSLAIFHQKPVEFTGFTNKI